MEIFISHGRDDDDLLYKLYNQHRARDNLQFPTPSLLGPLSYQFAIKSPLSFLAVSSGRVPMRRACSCKVDLEAYGV